MSARTKLARRHTPLRGTTATLPAERSLPGARPAAGDVMNGVVSADELRAAERADYIERLGTSLSSSGAVIVAGETDQRLVVEILHKNDGAPLSGEQVTAAMERVLEHGADLREMHDEGAVAAPEEIRDALIKLMRDAFALVRTFDARQHTQELRDMNQDAPVEVGTQP